MKITEAQANNAAHAVARALCAEGLAAGTTLAEVRASIHASLARIEEYVAEYACGELGVELPRDEDEDLGPSGEGSASRAF